MEIEAKKYKWPYHAMVIKSLKNSWMDHGPDQHRNRMVHLLMRHPTSPKISQEFVDNFLIHQQNMLNFLYPTMVIFFQKTKFLV